MKFAALKNTGTIVQVMSVRGSFTVISDEGYEYFVLSSDLRDVLPTDKGGWECA